MTNKCKHVVDREDLLTFVDKVTRLTLHQDWHKSQVHSYNIASINFVYTNRKLNE